MRDDDEGYFPVLILQWESISKSNNNGGGRVCPSIAASVGSYGAYRLFPVRPLPPSLQFWAQTVVAKCGNVLPLLQRLLLAESSHSHPVSFAVADGSEYSGNYGLSVEQLKDFHRPRILTLLSASPELLACETVASPFPATHLCASISASQIVAIVHCASRRKC